MRLAPGSVIKEHHDNDLSFEQRMVRIHIPGRPMTASISGSALRAAS
jgi:hypothetical protein